MGRCVPWAFAPEKDMGRKDGLCTCRRKENRRVRFELRYRFE